MENQLPFQIETYNPFASEVIELLSKAYENSLKHRNEFITPEHVLNVLMKNSQFIIALKYSGGDILSLQNELTAFLKEMEIIPDTIDLEPSPSFQLIQILEDADNNVLLCGKETIEIKHILKSLLNLEDSWAQYLLLKSINGEIGDFLSGILEENDSQLSYDQMKSDSISEKKGNKNEWKNLVVCLNDIYSEKNPLVGREDELKKTIRVLCRKDKNNPLHIGEPGVGKTALIYGLASMIEEGKVPPKLKDAKIYSMDIGSLIAGTQYRGDFEKRIKTIMEGVGKEKNAIIYIDEIHNLVGAGAIGESSMDASNILKPYLESGKIKFIGATTYDDYKRYFAKSKSIVRRFSNIDVSEPTIKETIHILRQLQKYYEEFHNVKYSEEAIEYAVKGSAQFINDRFLPDKAIDLIDESGAEKQIEENEDSERVVDKELVSRVLARMCKVDSLAITEDDNRNLENLDEKIKSQLYGQDAAISEVTESILMSKVGLNDENKPLASLLFVGPTGVGKTELAKLLAKELGIELLRFDMSEYTEKHAVAKLIGSPAGYVGYEDGGLLTDAIRKTPNAVLLLDEIEKAHSDIYNILLQVMDYAKLSDNKGNKADFRNVVIIMTSNAGAQFAAQSNVGFASRVTQGEAMLKQVKKIFKPEFINRLSATVVFNDMSQEMARQILEKKLRELQDKLNSKNVKLKISQEAKDFLLDKGFTKEYGARELDRIIHHELKRILMKELLKGKLKNDIEIKVELKDKKLSLCPE